MATKGGQTCKNFWTYIINPHILYNEVSMHGHEMIKNDLAIL